MMVAMVMMIVAMVMMMVVNGDALKLQEFSEQRIKGCHRWHQGIHLNKSYNKFLRIILLFTNSFIKPHTRRKSFLQVRRRLQSIFVADTRLSKISKYKDIYSSFICFFFIYSWQTPGCLKYFTIFSSIKSFLRYREPLNTFSVFTQLMPQCHN